MIPSSAVHCPEQSSGWQWRLTPAMVREFLAVAGRAAVQWALATLLLANGAAFCLIAAASEWLHLGPPCILCARVHRLLCPSPAGGEGRNALRLLCGAHLAAVAATVPEQRERAVYDQSSKDSKRLDADNRDKGSGLENRRVVSIGSEICEQDHHDTNGSDGGRPGDTDDGVSRPLVSLFEIAPIIAQPGNDNSEQRLHSVEGGERLTVGQLLSLRAKRRELDALRAELDSERRARVASEEYQRQLEEQGELDREAARLAMELVHETEREKLALQQQLEACRVRVQLCGGGMLAGEGGGAGGRDEDNNGGGNNSYQSLVDFLPGSVYSSSPDLVDLLKLYTEPGNGGRRHREGYAPAVTVVAEEVEEEEVAVPVNAESGVDVDVGATAAVGGVSLHERNTSCYVEPVTKAT